MEFPLGAIARKRFRSGAPPKWLRERIPQNEAQKKRNARAKLRYQIRVGNIKRGPCEVCGDPHTEGHHDDYDKPLEVRWLCKKHHKH